MMVGLTGGIASGKSTVSQMFKERGFAIIDADVAARKVVEPDQSAYQEIVQVFGEAILLPNQMLDRAKLGAIIFSDETKRQKLNSIVHPAVRKQMEIWKNEALAAGSQTVIYDIPLLFESRLTNLVEKTIVVFVEEQVQLERLMERNGLSESEALARITSQMPLSEKVKMADAVIDNNGEMDETRSQIVQLIKKWALCP
ncbi:dephospho-CoA kinase [Lederbergia galactosidilytica]|uniref:Dephospho-CoA kinase n=1 Tax=Lederbergia galactosidilytica TaxID=217031 RepID=A0A0Q9Y671_9BACI|nr:dephospho-CoA kinase [Lederbergia galactosidilytica]KRG11511.1 dephospho-CoA kinase [Lederbergia galactosidilytica]KRG14512.1 dephospho-CoA kinase [Virgibacillus soli]OAK68226.1 dephospho-CoA kinase [Lederbergia galactosidilytica]